jgi:hypothetical protein
MSKEMGLSWVSATVAGSSNTRKERVDITH